MLGLFQNQAAKGFTLIETLVAMMVLAICLGIIFQLFSGGLGLARVSEDYTRAAFLAKERMEEVLLFPELTPGEENGEFDEIYRWQVNIEHFPAVSEEESEKPIVYTFAIKVMVLWQDGPDQRDLTIQTVTIATLKPEDSDA